MELRRFNDTHFIFAEYSGDLGCVTTDSELLIKLSNGETITLKNFGDIDCGDNAPMYFTLSESNIKKLYQSPILKIRVTGTEYYADIENITFPNFFIDLLNCITD